jgi:hypothetical protein
VGGGTGIRARLRIWWSNPYEFESRPTQVYKKREVDIMSLDVLAWAGTIAAICGAVLNACKIRAGFLFYIFSNIVLIRVGAIKGETYNILLFSTFTLISVFGYIKWGMPKKGD